MWHNAARQRGSDGRWDYTRAWRDEVMPIGYCAGYPWDREVSLSVLPEPIVTAARKADEPFRDRYHTDGHATADEACDCYRQYSLDHLLRLDHQMLNEQRKCVVCGEWTQGFATVGECHLFVLCDAHRNRAEVEGLFEVGESWGS